MKKLDAQQIETLKQWAAKGATLSEIQKSLLEEFEITLTYMDVRFLLDDHGIELKEKPRQEEKKPDPAIATPEANQAEEPEVVGQVKVELDRLARPGAVVSGSVVFSDGQKAQWYLDQLGRLGLDPAQEGYRPSQEDIQDFQAELQNVLRSQGF